MEVPTPTFICFLNWTDQGAKNAKEANKRFQASKSMAEKLGGKLLSAYVTTGHYDVVLTLDMPNGEAMVKFTVHDGTIQVIQECVERRHR